MSEQVELWPKPIMYGTGFKITTHEKKYRAYREHIDKLIATIYEMKEEEDAD